MVDLEAEFKAVCDKLGIKQERTTLMLVEPDRLIAHVLLENENGRPYVDPRTGEIAKQVREWKVRI